MSARAKLVFVLSPVIFYLLAYSALATTVTTTIPISLTVNAGCSIQATGVSFGSVAPSLNLTSTGTVTVNCLAGTPYTVTLDGGTHSFASQQRNLMCTSLCSGFVPMVSYEVYKDPSNTQIWGDSGFGNTYMQGSGVAGTGSGAGQTLTVYGKIAGTGTSAGVFTDTLIVTVVF